jgi:hypothetical protein
MFVMEKCDVFFEVWTESLNIIYYRFGFKGLMYIDSGILCRLRNPVQTQESCADSEAVLFLIRNIIIPQ